MTFESNCLKEICTWFSHAERRHTIPMRDALRQWESDLTIMKLFHLWSSALTRLDYLNLDDLDRMCTSTMSCTHVAVALRYGSTHRQVSILSIHVMRARPWIIPQPNSEILDFVWCFFRNLKRLMKIF